MLDIEPVTRTVTVGPAEGLDVTEVTAIRPVWTGCTPPAQPVECQVQLRAHGEVYGCTAWLDGGAVRIRLYRPARGVAKGQAAVLYNGDAVLGSATIDGTSAAPQSRRRLASPLRKTLAEGSGVAEPVAVQFRRASRFRARPGVEVHDRHDSDV